MKKAIAYIRGRKYKGQWTADREHQIAQIKEHAKEYEIEIIEIVTEDNRLSVPGRLMSQFADVLKKCREQKADAIFVDIGKWRNNPIFNRFVAAIPGSGYSFIALPASRRTLEEIERQARKEKYERTLGKAIKKKRKTKTTEGASMITQWKERNKFPTKQFRNFQHLYAGVDSILDKFEQNADSTNKLLADVLHYGSYLTVDKKRWNEDNVRRTRKIIASSDFKEFKSIMDEETSR